MRMLPASHVVSGDEVRDLAQNGMTSSVSAGKGDGAGLEAAKEVATAAF